MGFFDLFGDNSKNEETQEAELGWRTWSHLGYEKSASGSSEGLSNLFGDRQEEHREGGGGWSWW